MDESIFKSYDIRGRYPAEITADAAYSIGRAFALYLSAKTIAVGRDIRSSSPALCKALICGITDQGADVIDIGIVSTPMLYFASQELATDGASIVTASHNPAIWNGMKLCRESAIPIGSGSGMEEIRELALAGGFPESPVKGRISTYDVRAEYFALLGSSARFGDRNFTIVVDCANAMGSFELPLLKSNEQITLHTLYEEPDGTFPNHEANPLKEETLDDLKQEVIRAKADIGIAFDGDADRVGFVDENGIAVPGDLILALIARDILETNPGSRILYDLRCTKAVREIVEEMGGTAIETPVGHSNIKRLMREHDALLAGEVSMHYFFKESGSAENTLAAIVRILNLLAKSDKSLSQLVNEVRRYHHSGELNFETHDIPGVQRRLQNAFSDGESSTLDGLKIRYPDWWFVVRASNTEPLLRLNVESGSKEMTAQKVREIRALITE